MLIVLLLAAQVATSSAASNAGVELAHQLKTDMDSHSLKSDDMTTRFIALTVEERDACLAEWERITEPNGRSLWVLEWLSSHRDDGVPKLAPIESRPLPRSVVLSEEQVAILQSSGLKYGIGGTFLVSGSFGTLGGLIALGLAAREDGDVKPAAIGTCISVGFLVIGVLLVASASHGLEQLARE